MRPPRALLPCLTLLAGALVGACSGGAADVAPSSAGPLEPDPRLFFAGEVVVVGALDPEEPGSVTVAAFVPGAEAPVLSRSWELLDPTWRTARGERRLYFHLDAQDLVPGAAPRGSAQMELVARWDPDGNPATEEPGVSIARARGPAGATDVVLEIPADRALVRELASPAGRAPGGG